MKQDTVDNVLDLLLFLGVMFCAAKAGQEIIGNGGIPLGIWINYYAHRWLQKKS